MSLKKRAFGPSMVSVVAAFSGASGCENEGITSCPSEQPDEGDRCSFADRCTYVRCGEYPRIEAVCQDGKIDIVEWSCNPPFPIDGGPDGSVDGSVDGSANPPVDASTAARVQGMDGG